MRARKAAFIVACLLALEGCVSAALSVAGLAGGAALEHIGSETIYQDIPSPIAGARLGALRALRRMGMAVEKDEINEDGWTIHAKSESREIKIEFGVVGDRRTRMDVKVSRDDFKFINDPSTTNEIIRQTAVELSRLTFQQIRIATAQMLLGELGYDTSKPDGILDIKTRNAIRGFQRKSKIPANGNVSAQLVTMLRKQQAIPKRVAPKSVPATSP